MFLLRIFVLLLHILLRIVIPYNAIFCDQNALDSALVDFSRVSRELATAKVRNIRFELQLSCFHQSVNVLIKRCLLLSNPWRILQQPWRTCRSSSVSLADRFSTCENFSLNLLSMIQSGDSRGEGRCPAGEGHCDRGEDASAGHFAGSNNVEWYITVENSLIPCYWMFHCIIVLIKNLCAAIAYLATHIPLLSSFNAIFCDQNALDSALADFSSVSRELATAKVRNIRFQLQLSCFIKRCLLLSNPWRI